MNTSLCLLNFIHSTHSNINFLALYIHDHFSDTLLPTSLPNDTNYSLCSSFLRNLETRTDLTWLVLDESDIKQAIMAIAQRSDSPRRPMAEEPFDLQARFKALHKHWYDLERLPDHPQRWELVYDTQLLPPLLKAAPLSSDQDGLLAEDGEQQQQQQQNTSSHLLTPEQKLAADAIFKYYLTTRAHKISYLKLHPPQPMAFAPVAKQPHALRTTWEDVLPDGKIEAGRTVAPNKLTDEQTWRPLYRKLDTEDIPYDWVAPGEARDMIMGLTQEEWDAHTVVTDARLKRLEERRARVKAWQDEVRPEREEREREEVERARAENAAAAAERERKKVEL